jgi:hypothetical protein
LCFYFLQGLDLPEVLVEVERCESSFDELLTVLEQDNCTCSDSKSTSCVAFILIMCKEAGSFDPIAEHPSDRVYDKFVRDMSLYVLD